MPPTSPLVSPVPHAPSISAPASDKLPPPPVPAKPSGAPLGTITQWSRVSVEEFHKALEVPNWAPWLAASEASLAARAQTFPQGQLVMVSPAGELMASLSLARIDWNGDPATLPHWDQIALDPAGELTSLQNKLFAPNGNTLVAMSMNVAPKLQKLQLPTVMLAEARALAHQLGVTHLLGSFRPIDFGQAKLDAIASGLPVPTFMEHCQATRDSDGLPRDLWLRVLTRNGMRILCEDTAAMVATCSAEDFAALRASWRPELWASRSGDAGKTPLWECGQVGHWTIHPTTGIARYQESNVWGELPL